MTVSAPPISDQYSYVDVAIGGVNKRNTVRQLANVHTDGLADCFVSHNRATVALLTWRNEHTNKDGRPTVAGFDGETWADNAHLDFDHPTDASIALGWARQVLDRLEAWGVDLGAVRVYFSGSKGVHVEIPHTLFGGFAPSKDLHRRLQRLAKRILGDIPFDTSVYDKLRLWRRENSRHGKTGLYKVRLTIAEARTLTIDQIKALAAHPRDTSAVPELAPIPDDEWLPNDELVELWAATYYASDTTEPRTDATATPTDASRDQLTIVTVAASWPKDGAAIVTNDGRQQRLSRHTDYLMPIVGGLARRGVPAEHIISLVAEAAEQASDRTFLIGRDWKSEIERLAASAVTRLSNQESDEPVKGWATLARTFPALANVLEALWPPLTLQVGDDPEVETDPPPDPPPPGFAWNPNESPKRRAGTGSDGAETCQGCAERDRTIEAMGEQLRESKAEAALLRSGTVPAAEALVLAQLATTRKWAQSKGDELVPIYVPDVARLAGVGDTTVTRAFNQIRRWQSDPEIAPSLPFRIEDHGDGKKSHLRLRVVPLPDEQPGRSRSAALTAVMRLPRDERRGKHGGERIACPKHPDAQIVRTRIWRCTEDDCTWVHQDTATLGGAPDQDGPVQAAEMYGATFYTELRAASEGPDQDGPHRYETWPGQDGPGLSTPVSFVSREDAEVAAGPRLRLVPDQDGPVRPKPWRCHCGSLERYPRQGGGWRCDGCGDVVLPAVSGGTFEPSSEWQEVPPGYPCPPGGEFRMDFQTGKNWARWPEPARVAGGSE